MRMAEITKKLGVGRDVDWRRKWQPTPVFLPGESQGRGSLVGCHLWGRTESDMTEATQQQQQQRCGPKTEFRGPATLRGQREENGTAKTTEEKWVFFEN